MMEDKNTILILILYFLHLPKTTEKVWTILLVLPSYQTYLAKWKK